MPDIAKEFVYLKHKMAYNVSWVKSPSVSVARNI